MISQKLIQLFKSFSSEQLKRLGDFVNSPYYNKQAYLALFYNELAKFYPGFPATELTKGKIFSKLYPGKVYNDSRIRNLTSGLMALFEKFMAAEGLFRDKISSRFYLLETLAEKQLNEMFERKYKNCREEIEKESEQNEIYYFNRFRLYQTRSIYVNRSLPNDSKENLDCYQGIVNESVKFFMASLLKNYSLMLNKNITFYKYEFDTRFINIILNYLKLNLEEYKNETSILLYYYFTVFYLNYDEKSYNTLESFVVKNFGKLDVFDASNSIINLINYCRRKSLEGNPEFERKAFTLYNFGLEKQIWNENVRIRPGVFRSIVSIACNCGEFAWCENFINSHKHLQSKEHITPNTNLCLGRLHFDKKQFDTALNVLAKVTALDSTYKYETDTLIIRIFYETGEIESYISKIKAFKKWINNNRTVISDRYRNIFRQMADYFEKLINLKLEPDEFRIQKMKREIADNKTLVNRQWFLMKLDEIEAES